MYLLVFQHVPVARTAQLIADLTGARPSTGWVTTALTEAAAALVEVEKLIRSLTVLAHVVHVDETSVSIAGARWWLHVAGTDRLTAYHLHRSRGRAAATSSGCCPATAASRCTTHCRSRTPTPTPTTLYAGRTWPGS